MPFRFLFGGKKQPEHPTEDADRLDQAPSDEESEDEDIRFTEELNEVYFMNPNFASSFRSSSTSPVPRLTHKSYTRKLSSRAREYKRMNEEDPEYEVDVALAPSAFAFQTIPMGNSSFCSRDDSEIATRTMWNNTPDSSFRRSSMRSPHANPMYLIDTYSMDDGDVGSQTGEKIRLRHMGSALSYRLSLSGTPDYSVCGDDESCVSKPGHLRRYSDLSERLGSFKERNKMKRLESIVAGMQKPQGSVIEFGVVDPDQFMNMPTPRLFKSSSEQLMPSDKMPNDSQKAPAHLPPPALLENHQLESYPISFLDDIVEEEEDDSFEGHHKGKNDQKTEQSDTESLSEPTTPKNQVMKSSFKVAIQPIEINDDDGFKNPAYGLDLEWPSPMDSAESFGKRESDMGEKKAPLYRIESVKRSSSKKGKQSTSSGASITPRRRTEKRDEALHVALMERYLLESVVNKYLLE